MQATDLRSMTFEQIESRYKSMETAYSDACKDREKVKAERDQAIRDKTFAKQQLSVVTEVHNLGQRIVDQTQTARQNNPDLMSESRMQWIVRNVTDMTMALKRMVSNICEAIKTGYVAACDAMYNAAVRICNFIYDHGLQIFCAAAVITHAITVVASVGLMILGLITGNLIALEVNPFDNITI